jgi:N6-adenosine-specific RNA methylase IME4
MQDIQLDAIRRDGGTQPRESLDAFVVQDYADALERGDTFPPVQVVYDGTDYWLYDGFHRVHAYEKAGRDSIPSDVTQGTQKDAQWLSLAANKDHGLRRTRADKRRAVVKALEGWGKSKSFAEIGRHIGVADTTVSRTHERLLQSRGPSQNNQRGKGGRVKGADGIWRPARRKPKPTLEPDVVEQLKDTHVADDPAEQRELAKVKEDEQDSIVRSIKDEGLSVKEARSRHRRKEREREVSAAESEPPDLESVTQRYSVVYADPPWRYDFAETTNRRIENHYSTMDLQAICNLQVPGIAAEHAVLFLWATTAKLPEAMRVMDAWGFTYKSSFCWVKDKIGMGYYCRGQHELLLIGKRGSPPVPPPETRVSSVVSAPRTEHSSKPPVFYEIIERMYPQNSKIELFARVAREGWDTWGAMAGES